MPRSVDLTGQKFGKLTVLEKAGLIKYQVYWYCECVCGAWALVRTADLRNGHAKSCGCGKHREGAANGNFKHGGRVGGKTSAELRSWQSMREFYPDEIVFEWNDFTNFFRDMGFKPSSKHVLARHDIREPHGPTNTYWRNPQNEKRERMQRDSDPNLCVNIRELLFN